VTLSAELTISAASARDFPLTALPEVAMVGRSNVGKSSLINALLKQKIARTSAAPGKTRLANYYLIQSQTSNPESRGSFYLVDLPGYGYARGGVTSVETFEGLTTEYFDPARRGSRRLAGVLHLVDGRHPELESDAAAHAWLARTGVALAIVATKMDKLKQAEQRKHLRVLGEAYDTLILPASVLKNSGLSDIWKVIRTWAASAREGGRTDVR
jgi:GTP-binding protein